MGPQPNSCGNEMAEGFDIDGVKWLQWGHSQTAVETGRFDIVRWQNVRFNGATAKQLWKLGLDALADPRIRLQWGHSQTAVETTCGLRPWKGGCWLQWGHSQTAVETEYVERDALTRMRFNGATAKQLWKPVSTVPWARHLGASMGPQPNSCGNMPSVSPTSTVCDASMGPQPNSCGNPRFQFPPAGQTNASMGPQPNSCGNSMPSSRTRLGSTLQWGHSQTAVETRAIASANSGSKERFNGATAKQLWKPGCRAAGSTEP